MISTTPVALSQVPVGSRVQVIVSSGPKLVTIPDVTGKQDSVATATLQDAGFKVSEVKQDSNQPKGQVISQSPSSGVSVAEGTRVTITVSRGIPKVSVPDVTGKSTVDATNTLKSAGFNVSVNEVEASKDQVGKVISQSPAAGSQQDKGSTVTITVGKKKKSKKNNGNGSGGATPSGP